VDLWTVGTGKVAVLTSLPTAVRSLAFSRDGTMLVTVGHDTSVRLWNVATRQLVAVLSGDTEQVNDAVFGPNDQTLITASGDATARVWDLNPADEVRALCAALQGSGFAAQWQALNPTPGPDPCPARVRAPG
jgi:WD40 repeat protein